MSLALPPDGRHNSLRSRRERHWRWIAAAVIAGVAATAFLIWGPIGLGSGPVTVDGPSGGQILGPQDQAWGMMVPVLAGNSAAVTDQVALVGGDGYLGPRVLSLQELATGSGDCGGTYPWAGPDGILSSCAIDGLHRLIGVPLPGNNPGVNMVIKIGPPAARSGCWVVTAIVVHYHVGIRHYTATGPADFAACKTAAEEHGADLALGQPE